MLTHIYCVPVAQLDRVSASDAEGCEFEPRRVRHFFSFDAHIKNKRYAQKRFFDEVTHRAPRGRP